MQNEIGFDRYGNALEEFMVLRNIGYDYAMLGYRSDYDPREYSVIKGPDSNWYLISINDFKRRLIINRYENRPDLAPVPIKIRPISDAIHYEIVRDGFNNIQTNDVTFNNKKLVKKFHQAVKKGQNEIKIRRK